MTEEEIKRLAREISDWETPRLRIWPDRHPGLAVVLANFAIRTRDRTLEEAARIAEAQPYYFDTNLGMRQEWVKQQIAKKIRALIGSAAHNERAP